MTAKEPINQKKQAGLPAGLDSARVLNARQAAEMLSISICTLRRLDWAGKLPPAVWLSDRRKGWRVSDLCAFVATRAVA
jgi:predicted DNA-binding transcriptional regulator AlpA